MPFPHTSWPPLLLLWGQHRNHPNWCLLSQHRPAPIKQKKFLDVCLLLRQHVRQWLRIVKNTQQRLVRRKDVNKQKLCVTTDPTLRRIVTHAGIPAKLRKVSRSWHWPADRKNDQQTKKLSKQQIASLPCFKILFSADGGAPAAKPGGVSSTWGRAGFEPAGVEHVGRGCVERPGADRGRAAGRGDQGGRHQSAAAEQQRSIGEGGFYSVCSDDCVRRGLSVLCSWKWTAAPIPKLALDGRSLQNCKLNILL